MFFLKCLFLIEEGNGFWKMINSLENSLLVLKFIDWKNDFLVRSVIFDLLFMYRIDGDRNIEIVFLFIEKLEMKRL